jgi:ribosomal protein S18 acetylase RimI-like enzyme
MGLAHPVIVLDTDMDAVASWDLRGFFEGWPAAPDAASLLRVLRNSSFGVIAREDDRVVGLICALSDGELAVYISLLEVRRSHRDRGIGSELVRRVLTQFEDAYMIDAVCDPDVAPFYERLGMARLAGMAHRNRRSPILRGVE